MRDHNPGKKHADVAIDDELFISSKCSYFPAGEDSYLAYNHVTQSSEIISRDQLKILQFTNQFRTVRGHQKLLIESGWQDDGSEYIDTSIKELVHRGFLLGRTSFLSQSQKQSSSIHPPPITSIAWPTRDRNKLLERGLRSFIANNQRHSREVRYVILDDSRSENSSKDLQKLLSSIGSQSNPIVYAGLKDKLAFTEKLLLAGKSVGLPKEVVQFALLGPSTSHLYNTFGANLNTLLLSTHGQLVLTTDDDIICNTVVIDEQNDQLALSSKADPTGFHFYKDRDELLASIEFQEVDILQSHEKYLGRTVPQVLPQQQSWHAVNVENVSPQLVHRLLAKPAGIDATMGGICGDSGMGYQHIVLGLTGPSREQIMQSESIYKTALTSREVLRHTLCATISDGGLLMAGNMGLDNREILPPFFPVGRNADGLFATILNKCFSNSLIGHLPLALLHSPTTGRKISRDEFFAVRLRMTDILSLIVQAYTGPAISTDRANGLRLLGDYLLNIGNLPLQQFEEFMRLLWLKNSAKKLEYFDFLLDYYRNQPDFWAKDVEYFKKQLKIAAVNQTAYLPADLSESYTENSRISIFRDLVADFSSLLIWWPAILDLTKELLSENITLVRAIHGDI